MLEDNLKKEGLFSLIIINIKRYFINVINNYYAKYFLINNEKKSDGFY